MLKFIVLPSMSAVVVGDTWSALPAAGAGGNSGTLHQAILPPRNPAASLWPAPSFMASCAQGDDGAQCNDLALAAISHARQTLENMPGMSFSLAGYEKLTADEQLFVTVDLERTARGLPPVLVLTRSLDAIAQAGAQADRDPVTARRRPDHLPRGYLGGWLGQPAGR